MTGERRRRCSCRFMSASGGEKEGSGSGQWQWGMKKGAQFWTDEQSVRDCGHPHPQPLSDAFK